MHDPLLSTPAGSTYNAFIIRWQYSIINTRYTSINITISGMEGIVDFWPVRAIVDLIQFQSKGAFVLSFLPSPKVLKRWFAFSKLDESRQAQAMLNPNT